MFSNRIAAILLLSSIALLGCKGEAVLNEAAVGLIDARKAIEEGDSAKAIELLTASIESEPSPWSYYERAKLQAEDGDDKAATADIDAGLELDPEHSDLLWLQKQMKKSKSSRFKQPPPSVNK